MAPRRSHRQLPPPVCFALRQWQWQGGASNRSVSAGRGASGALARPGSRNRQAIGGELKKPAVQR